ncbi:MAG: TetR/AcrR family transcriptional regulator [Parasphingopyxis sp.]|uniref:TetR/AcrR family transcriptional regulator n=1 Tax=Parasphingopyxis sp. TaxID=1920299 RepID=UPI003F9EE170
MNEATKIERNLNQREKQRIRTRAKILDVALTTFAAKGFEGATLRDIAAEADVNHALIKYHFNSKDNLWKEAVRFLFERMHEELAVDAKEEAKLSELDRLKNAIRRYVRYCARHPEHARIMVQESIRDGKRLDWAVENFIGPQHADARPAFLRHMREGLWPDVQDISISYILVAASQMIFVLAPEIRRLYGVDTLSEEVVDAHAEAMIELFFNHKVEDD